MSEEHEATYSMNDRQHAWTEPRPWIWLAVAALMTMVHLPMLIAAFWPPREIITDFYQDWASARNFLNGLPIYTDHAETIPRYIGSVDPVCYCNRVNAHPPTSVFLFLAVAWADYRPALLAWNIAGLAMLGLSLWIVWRQLRPTLPVWWAFPALALALLCWPLLTQMYHGQLNLVLLSLVTATWAAERSGRPRLAGALVGAAMAVKIFPGFLFLYLILRRQWSAVAVGALTVTLLAAVTMAVFGPDIYLTYVRDVMPRLELFRSSWFNASLVGFWTRLFDPSALEGHVQALWHSPAAARAGIVVSWTAVVAAVTWSIRRARTRAELDQAFACTVVGMLLCSPITWHHSFVLLLVPAAVFWLELPRYGLSKLLFIAALAALFLEPLSLRMIPGGPLHGIATPVQTLTVVSYQVYALVTLLVLTVLKVGAIPGAGKH